MTYTQKENYPAIKSEVMPFVPVWISLEDIKLNEISQTQKDKHFDLTYM